MVQRERDSVPRHSCRRCVMKNLRAEAHGTEGEILYHDIHVVGVWWMTNELKLMVQGRDSSVPRHSCRRCVMDNLRAEAHGTEGERFCTTTFMS